LLVSFGRTVSRAHHHDLSFSVTSSEEPVFDDRTVGRLPGADSYKLAVAVHLMLIDAAGRVLFGQRHASNEGDIWNLPSGYLQAGESVVAALIRRAWTAIGVAVDEQAVELVHVMHASSGGGRVAFFFAVERWTGDPANREPGTYSRVDWFPPSALPYNVVPYCRSALEWVAANYHFSLYGW
jgi:8-oxo-dGTP diphosphatase